MHNKAKQERVQSSRSAQISLIIGRHATDAHLRAAQARIVDTLLAPSIENSAEYVTYRCVGVRIDSLGRLIADCVLHYAE